MKKHTSFKVLAVVAAMAAMVACKNGNSKNAEESCGECEEACETCGSCCEMEAAAAAAADTAEIAGESAEDALKKLEALSAEAQANGTGAEGIPFQTVEVKPLFNGSDANEFASWVAKNIKYPEAQQEAGVEGRVILQFTVAEDGSVKNVKVLRGVNEALDAEAVRVVSSSPAWTPGVQGGKKVKVSYTFPVLFQIR